MVEFGDDSFEGNGDLGMADEGVAIGGFACGVHEYEDDVVFEGTGDGDGVDKDGVGFFIVFKAVFGGVFLRPIRWADNDFGVTFDFFAEEFGRHEVPANCEADFTKAGGNDGWLVAAF